MYFNAPRKKQYGFTNNDDDDNDNDIHRKNMAVVALVSSHEIDCTH